MLINLILLLFVVSCLPAVAHEGNAGEHLILGLDTGLVVGIVIGFSAGVGSTILYLRKFTNQ